MVAKGAKLNCPFAGLGVGMYGPMKFNDTREVDKLDQAVKYHSIHPKREH